MAPNSRSLDPLDHSKLRLADLLDATMCVRLPQLPSPDEISDGPDNRRRASDFPALVDHGDAFVD